VRIVLSVSECGTQLEVRAESNAAAKPMWVEAVDAEHLARAPEEAIPTEFLFCRVLAKDPYGVSRGAKQVADVTDVRVDPQSKLRFQVRFVESEEEGWLKVDDLSPSTTGAGAHRDQEVTAPLHTIKVNEGDSQGDETHASACNGKRKSKASGTKAKKVKIEDDAASSRKLGKSAACTETQGESSNKWSKKNSQAADAWEEALNALQPDSDDGEGDGEECTRSNDSASRGRRQRSVGASSGGEASSSTGTRTSGEDGAAPTAATRDPRLQGFRIGGQAETAEERGEGWCGPWSTARALLERRQQALVERMEELGGQPPPPLVVWEPKTVRKRGGRAGRTGRASGKELVPSLQSMAVEFVAANIDCVEDFGWLTPAVQHALATELCRRRLFGNAQLRLLAPEGLPLSELVAPDCHKIETPQLHEVLTPLADDGSRLGLLSLGFCGRCVLPETCQLISRMPSLHSLTLTGAYRVTDNCVATIASARGDALRSFTLSGNSQLGAASVSSLTTYCPNLEVLALEDLAHLPASAVEPIGKLANLVQLSLKGLMLLDGPSLHAATRASVTNIKSLSLAGCGLLVGSDVADLVAKMTSLRELNLEGVELLTDGDLVRIADARRSALSSLTLRKCVQLSDAAIESLAAATSKSLTHLSLNNVPALGDAALVALMKHCANSLESLDVSWCRAITDDGLGSLVDASPRLAKLTLWGCTQISEKFYNGHSRDDLLVIGRGLSRDI